MGRRGPQGKGEVRGFGRKDNGNQKRSQRGTKMGRGPRERVGMGKGRSQRKEREGWGSLWGGGGNASKKQPS